MISVRDEERTFPKLFRYKIHSINFRKIQGNLYIISLYQIHHDVICDYLTWRLRMD